MPNVMAALSNTGDALCSTPQSLANAHWSNAVQYRRMQDLDAKWILHVAKFGHEARAAKYAYIV